MTLGEKIKKHRMYAGLTQAQLGEKADISPCVVSTYENGSRLPKENSRLRIARACGTDPLELLQGLTEEDEKRFLIRTLTESAKVESLDFQNGRVMFSMDMTAFPDFPFLNYVQSVKGRAGNEEEREVASQYIDFLLTTYPKYSDKSAWANAEKDFADYLKRAEKG